MSRDSRAASTPPRALRPTRERIAPKPSEVRRPRATPSHSARSMSCGRRLVASPSSAAACAAPHPRPAAVAPSVNQDPSARPQEPWQVVTEDDGDRRGAARRRQASASRGLGEPQPPTSPSWQPVDAPGSPPHPAAANAPAQPPLLPPCSCSIGSAGPSIMVSRFGARCCHRR
jgi:hypothetical protein